MKYQQHITQEEDGNFVGSLSNGEDVVYVTGNCKSINEVNKKINSYLSSIKRNGYLNSATEARPANLSASNNERVSIPTEIKEVPLQRQQSIRPSQKKTCCHRG
jgi:hypothetical protein